ncbi:MAG: TolC family protein [Planctomycetes bacterium]|nr:TolC family protein [Planctomycetota bacterium]
MRRRFASAQLLALATAFAACTVRPDGETPERDRAAAAGRTYAVPFDDRELPALRPEAPLGDYLAHAAAANGLVEAAWHRWVAALEQVPQDATQSTTAMVGIEHRLDGGDALDRTGLALASDAMNNIVWPGRLASQGEAALARARVAATEFDRERLRLQRDVADAYWALALRDEELRLVERLRGVLATNVPSVAARLGAGGATQAALLDAEVALARVDAELIRMREGRAALAEALRARVGAPPEGVDPKPALVPIRPLRAEEIDAVATGTASNPEHRLRLAQLAAAEADVTVREWQRMPSFSLRGLLMGDGIATIGGMLTLPFLRGTAIEASIRQARAEAHAADALRRQAGADAAAAVRAELATLRAVELEAAVLERELAPRLRQAADIARASWSAGRGPLAEWATALAASIDVERAVARLRAEHASGRARLQELMGDAGA